VETGQIGAVNVACYEIDLTALFQGLIRATELARRAAAPRTIAFLEERLVLSASRLHIGCQCGGYRDKSYERDAYDSIRGRFATTKWLPNSDGGWRRSGRLE
jgi:hypothetical protein